MIGKSTLVWLCLATVASGILYHTSYRVQEEQEHLASLNRQIAQEQQSIQVLRAEWAYLNDPTRLERLATEHSTLRPTKAEQMVALAAVPVKPETPTPVPGVPADQAKPVPAPESTYVASAAPAAPAVQVAVAQAAPAPMPKAQVVALKAPDVQASAPVKAAAGKPAPTVKAAKQPERVDSIGALMASLDAADKAGGKVTLASASGSAAKSKTKPILMAEQTLSAKLGAAR
ncbi:cell division protein FtsL [Nitrospirillum viridazoti]|uniref:Uncharacterized protein n=1 Tax=Nitrospirillum viridazoti CBAmc TaxID=1441467 RepID=A0A248JQY4_9PROT|nr:hypothetical protein [Nitrospirillum amazonense]ASG21115.1 hypothetical protein Y958_09980 [Nitrospirillum amazonense CBAmc]TWB28091.1 hypothetical protein FBZ91_1305 [Nitrospirillum amazonense]